MTKAKFKRIVDIGEMFFAGFVLVGVVIFTVTSISHLVALDWEVIETFYELINRVLIIIVGLELIKLLVTHDIYAISDLLTFVVARKMLKPDLTSLDILIDIIAFSILFMLNTKFKDRNRIKIRKS